MHTEPPNPKDYKVAEELNVSSSVQAHRIVDPLLGSCHFMLEAIRAAGEIGRTPVGPVICPESKENQE